MPDSTLPKLAYTIDETRQLIPFGRTRIYELLRSGALRSRKHGKRRMILASDLTAFLDSLGES
jgi:Helix-turn-helix domain